MGVLYCKLAAFTLGFLLGGFKSGFLGLGGFSLGGGFKILPIPLKNGFYYKILE